MFFSVSDYSASTSQGSSKEEITENEADIEDPDSEEISIFEDDFQQKVVATTSKSNIFKNRKPPMKRPSHLGALVKSNFSIMSKTVTQNSVSSPVTPSDPDQKLTQNLTQSDCRTPTTMPKTPIHAVRPHNFIIKIVDFLVKNLCYQFLHFIDFLH